MGERVLMIGAGAVGLVYGQALARGGADVTYYARPSTAAQVRQGVVLYGRNRGEPAVQRLTPTVLHSAEAVAAQRFDQVWVTVPTPSLADPALQAVLGAIGDAVLVALQPGAEVDAVLRPLTRPDRLVYGVIGFIAFQSPLPAVRPHLRAESGAALSEGPGIVYYYPPLSDSPFSGPPDAVARVLAPLRAGRCPARRTADAPRFAAFPGALMMAYLAGLELEDWSFGRFARGPRWALSQRAGREALAVMARDLGARAPLPVRLLNGALLKAGVWLAAKIMPFDLETYLAYHFTKVGGQTRLLLREYVALGERHGVPTPAVQELLAALAA